MRSWSPLLLLPVVGCQFAHRHLKFAAPEQIVVAAEPPAGLLGVEIEDRHGTRSVETQTMHAEDHRRFNRPTILADRDTVVFSTARPDPVRFRMYVRGNGLFDRHDFQPVLTVTGPLPLRYANELSILPEDLDQPVRIAVADLQNPYNNYAFDHGDLLLVVADAADGTSERRLFRSRDAGIYLGGFAGVLATVPLTSGQLGVAPILAAGPTFGWRSSRAAGPMLAFDTVEVVLSAGVGSTAIEAVAQQEMLDNQVDGVFNAVLVGGGIRAFRIVTMQGFVNTTQFFRDFEEAPFTLAIGLDASELAAATRDVVSRLFREHPLKERNPR